jgi:protein-S-isoprenylcysteine O-methyltransferase Ste14
MSGTGASERSSTVWNVVKTTVFLIVLWSLFLFAIPIGISIIEIDAGIQRFPSKPLLAGPLLILSTFLVVWAAMTLAVKGHGTPVAADPTREFVTSGPYAYVRHPFVAGLTAQIVALGIALGSVPVIAYAAVLMAVWYYGVRPREERGLDARFGRRAQEYRRKVRGFRPF